MEKSTIEFNINAEPFYPNSGNSNKKKNSNKFRKAFFFSRMVLNDLKELKNRIV